MDSKTLQNVDKIFKSLVEIKDFKYTYNQLYTYLNKSDILEKIEEIETRKTKTPYTIFINEQLDKGLALKNVLELWEKTKKNNKK